MKKLLVTGLFGAFALIMTSCGGGHSTCDAFRESDYTKYKADQNQNIEIIQELSEVTK